MSCGATNILTSFQALAFFKAPCYNGGEWVRAYLNDDVE